MKRIDLQISDTEHEWLKNKVATEERSQTEIIREMIRESMRMDAIRDVAQEEVFKLFQKELRPGGLLA
jgi:phosphoserine aminotransferase